MKPPALIGGLIEGSPTSTINVRVQPRASSDRVVGYHDGTLRVGVTAPPENGRANAAVLELLAEELGVAKSRLRIIRGHTSRGKVVAVEGLTAVELEQRLGVQAHPGRK